MKMINRRFKNGVENNLQKKMFSDWINLGEDDKQAITTI